ncbi:hypothetical protein BDM02DRAFT_2347308 [Thelephora ganbajun]|uniref:Uncharacterized protein n=1 Tax=Thelephora ganbajun TaxID=370292 RepID=A0ACB6ZFE7_THEGA|nr:hypothetical protein BDM02DRAFT_2347308 [Thelephora ganbajun]
MGSCNLPFGHISLARGTLVLIRGWSFFLASQPPYGFIRWILFRSSFYFLCSWRNSRPLHRRVPLSPTLSAPRPHIVTTHMYAHRPSPGVPWSLASLVFLVVTRYCLIFSRFPFFPVCFPQSWVIIRVFWFYLCPFFCLVFSFRFLVLNVLARSLRRKKYCINLYCILPPSRSSFLSSSLVSSFLFVTTRPYLAQLSPWYPYLCILFAKGPRSCPFLHSSVSRPVVYKVLSLYSRLCGGPFVPCPANEWNEGIVDSGWLP